MSTRNQKLSYSHITRQTKILVSYPIQPLLNMATSLPQANDPGKHEKETHEVISHYQIRGTPRQNLCMYQDWEIICKTLGHLRIKRGLKKFHALRIGHVVDLRRRVHVAHASENNLQTFWGCCEEDSNSNRVVKTNGIVG